MKNILTLHQHKGANTMTQDTQTIPELAEPLIKMIEDYDTNQFLKLVDYAFLEMAERYPQYAKQYTKTANQIDKLI